MAVFTFDEMRESGGLCYLSGFRYSREHNIAVEGREALNVRVDDGEALVLSADPAALAEWLRETTEVKHDELGAVPVNAARRHDLHAQIDVWLDGVAAQEPLLNLSPE